MPRSFAAPRWRIDLARTAATGLGGLAALLIANPHGTAATTLLLVVGALLGLFIALGVEWISRLRAEVVRLQSIERERDVEREQSERMRRLLEWQAQVAKREAALNAIHMKIYSDAFLEVGGVQRIPFEALLARIDVSTRAANLHIPLERPDL